MRRALLAVLMLANGLASLSATAQEPTSATGVKVEYDRFTDTTKASTTVAFESSDSPGLTITVWYTVKGKNGLPAVVHFAAADILKNMKGSTPASAFGLLADGKVIAVTTTPVKSDRTVANAVGDLSVANFDQDVTVSFADFRTLAGARLIEGRALTSEFKVSTAGRERLRALLQVTAAK